MKAASHFSPEHAVARFQPSLLIPIAVPELLAAGVVPSSAQRFRLFVLSRFL